VLPFSGDRHSVDFTIDGRASSAADRHNSQYRIVTPDYLVRLKTSGWTIGGNGKFQFGDHWFVSGRGGLFRANTRTRLADITTSQVVYSHKNAKTSYYAGVGAGYDFNEHFGLGVNFDYYRAKVNLGGGDKTSGFGIKTYGVTAEYRF